MKHWYLLVVCAWAAFAQSSLPPKVPADKVVAKVDGKDVTAGDIYSALTAMPPQFVQMYNQNPKYALQQLFMMRYLAEEAEKLKLGDNSPYKEQLAAERANVLASALLGYQQDHIAVSDESVQKYYDEHKAQYEESKIKAIVLRFKAVIDPKASVEERAKADLENQIYNVHRTEDETRALAADLSEKLKNGADFGKLVIDDSDDPASRAKGGDFGTVDAASKHVAEIKQAVAKLKPGEISAPIRIANAYLIVRLEERTQQSREQAAAAIMQDLRKVQLKAWFDDVTRRFQPSVENPEFFTQQAPVPTLQAPPPVR